MGKVIEQNMAFMLTEIEVNRICPKELQVNIFPNGRSFTPYGAFELAKRLIKWSSENDSDIARITKSNKW